MAERVWKIQVREKERVGKRAQVIVTRGTDLRDVTTYFYFSL